MPTLVVWVQIVGQQLQCDTHPLSSDAAEQPAERHKAKWTPPLISGQSVLYFSPITTDSATIRSRISDSFVVLTHQLMRAETGCLRSFRSLRMSSMPDPYTSDVYTQPDCSAVWSTAARPFNQEAPLAKMITASHLQAPRCHSSAQLPYLVTVRLSVPRHHPSSNNY